MLKASCKLLLVVVVLAGLAGSSARAQDEASKPYVVLVGIDQYADGQIKPRKHAEADVKALFDLFTSKGHLGVDPKNIKLLLGSPDKKRASEPATKANILSAVTWLEKTAGKNDLVIFAFIGEGAPLKDRSCYFAVDSSFKNRDKDAVAALDIESRLDHLKSQRFLALIDVNFMGFEMKGKETPPDPDLNNYYREFLGNEELKDSNPSRVILLANSGVKPSLNLDKHGIFTQVLLDAFSGKADTEGYQADGNITIAELIKFVRQELPNLARQNGKTDEEKGQNPGVLDYQNNDFIVVLNPDVNKKSVERLGKFDQIAKDKNLAKDLIEEGSSLLKRMPKLEAKQSLRKVYQHLADGDIDLAKFSAERKSIIDSTLISEREADDYAKMVMRAVRLVKQQYFKDVNQAQLLDGSVRGLYRLVNEKLPSDILERLDEIKSLKDQELIKLLADARLHLGKREDLANGKDITFSLHSMLGKLDKHTDYVDPETAAKMRDDIRGHFFGIGVQIRKNSVKDMLQVVTPIVGSPAYKAKMQAGDIITTIIREYDSEGNKLPEKEVLTTKGMTTEEAVKKIVGREGTQIKVLVEREGSKEPIEFNLIRGKVEVESVLGHKRNSDDSWNYVVDPDNKICYVRLTQFSSNTARDLSNVMKKLSQAGIKGFVLDLRFNPGGLLDSAVKISDLFIDDGLIVSIRPRNGPETSYIGRADGSYVAFPMVCLVNGGSASASEIVSACLQDHHRAIIVGSRSYGKGSVQTIHPFDTGGTLKLTTATFWRPSGRNLNKSSTQGRDEDEWGVTPDPGFLLDIGKKEVNDLQVHLRDQEIIRGPNPRPNPDAKVDFHDRQLDLAVEYLRNQIRASARNGAKKAG